MGYANKKGYTGEVEMANELSEAIGEFGYKVKRIGAQEKNKKWLFGDVAVVNDDGNCILSHYFLESKKQANPSLWKMGQEATENAIQYGKVGAIIRLERQRKGNKVGRAGNPDIYYAMKPKVIIRLLNELQRGRGQS